MGTPTRKKGLHLAHHLVARGSPRPVARRDQHLQPGWQGLGQGAGEDVLQEVLDGEAGAEALPNEGGEGPVVALDEAPEGRAVSGPGADQEVRVALPRGGRRTHGGPPLLASAPALRHHLRHRLRARGGLLRLDAQVG